MAITTVQFQTLHIRGGVNTCQ